MLKCYKFFQCWISIWKSTHVNSTWTINECICSLVSCSLINTASMCKNGQNFSWLLYESVEKLLVIIIQSHSSNTKAIQLRQFRILQVNMKTEFNYIISYVVEVAETVLHRHEIEYSFRFRTISFSSQKLKLIKKNSVFKRIPQQESTQCKENHWWYSCDGSAISRWYNIINNL